MGISIEPGRATESWHWRCPASWTPERRRSSPAPSSARALRLTHDSASATRLRIVTGQSRAANRVLHEIGLDCYPTRSAALSAGSRTSFLSRVNASWNS
ncbi:hypothetical protein [Amycolatopsis vancoresmycina]|uniref:hypothetical protein n=1 Tax=Amycolatopsis vancoresmycina TaxID=208444 RepID=UPI00039B5C1F|nr:hypothetical protein [Amycolatopsis vancoresmycina]